MESCGLHQKKEQTPRVTGSEALYRARMRKSIPSQFMDLKTRTVVHLNGVKGDRASFGLAHKNNSFFQSFYFHSLAPCGISHSAFCTCRMEGAEVV